MAPLRIVEIDHADDDALARFVALENELRLADAPRTVEARRSMLDGVRARRLLAAATPDGTWVGIADATVPKQGPNAVFLRVRDTASDHEREALLDALRREAEVWARTYDVDLAVAQLTDPSDAEVAAWASFGFHVVSTLTSWQLDLRGADDASEPEPTDVHVVRLRDDPERAAATHEVWCSAVVRVPDPHASEYVTSLDAWLADFEPPSDGERPAECFIALDTATDEVIGVATLGLRTNPEGVIAHHWFTGVALGRTGQGVARALKSASIAWARRNGVDELKTVNHDTNAAMLHLNESLGYQRAAVLVAMERSLRLTKPM